MQKSKLIALLRTFSKQEMKDFEKFISSPYFSPGRNLKPLYNVLKKFHPLYDSGSFNEEKVFRKLYPGKKYEKKRSSHALQVMTSDLLTMAEKFMVNEGFKSGGLNYHFNTGLGEMYRNRKLLSSAVKIFQKNSHQLDSDDKNLRFYTRRLETNILLANTYYSMLLPEKVYERSKKDLLYIYAFIFHTMAGYFNLSTVFKKRYNLTYKGTELIKHFVKTFDPVQFETECEDDGFETKNLLLIYYYILRSRIDKYPEESLMKAMDIYFKIFGKVNRITKFDLFTIMFSRLISNIRFDFLFLKKADEIIDFVWKKGILSHASDEYLDMNGYDSALSVKTAIGDKHEIHDFIIRYSDKVDPKHKESIFNYSLAFLSFKERLFEKCLELLSRKDSLGQNFAVKKYRLQICSLYELGHFEDSLRIIDSFEHYLRKNSIVSEDVRAENLRFTGGIKKLIKMQHNSFNGTDVDINQILEMEHNTVFGFWFEEKVEEMACKNPN